MVRDVERERVGQPPLRPASNCFSAPIICASVCLLFDIPLPLSFVRNHNQIRAETGDQVRRMPPAYLGWYLYLNRLSRFSLSGLVLFG
jgi:hypothetical protein